MRATLTKNEFDRLCALLTLAPELEISEEDKAIFATIKEKVCQC